MGNSVPNLIFCLILIVYLISFVDSRVRYKLRTRPECREKGPRRAEELSNIIISGFVEQVYLTGIEDGVYSGSVLVKRVFKGPSNLLSSKITVQGFNEAGVCYSNVRKWDTWIMPLGHSSGGFRLNGTLLRITLPNLDKINALVKDVPFRRRPAIIETPCERKYCENNGNCIDEENSGGGILSRAKCQCLERCTTSYNPVCGSNGETFSNECQIRLVSCQRGKNYFTRYPSACELGRRSRDI